MSITRRKEKRNKKRNQESHHDNLVRKKIKIKENISILIYFLSLGQRAASTYPLFCNPPFPSLISRLPFLRFADNYTLMAQGNVRFMVSEPSISLPLRENPAKEGLHNRGENQVRGTGRISCWGRLAGKGTAGEVEGRKGENKGDNAFFWGG